MELCGVSFRSVGAGSKPARGSGCRTRQGARKLHGLPLPSVGGGVPTAPQRQGADFCPSLRASAHTGAAIRIPVLGPKQRDGLPRAASSPRNDRVGNGSPAYCNRLRQDRGHWGRAADSRPYGASCQAPPGQAPRARRTGYFKYRARPPKAGRSTIRHDKNSTRRSAEARSRREQPGWTGADGQSPGTA